MKNTKVSMFKKAAAIGAMALGGIGFQAQAAEDTIKVGVLHSLSGTMAISETTLKDTVLMMVEEQNRKGGPAQPSVERPELQFPLKRSLSG